MALAITLLASGCELTEGDSCTGAVGSCPSSTEGLFCMNGRVARIPCHGPRGCTETGLRFECDQSVASAGEPCATETSGACTADRQTFLVCTNGVYTLQARCLGPSGCRNQSGQITCDESRANVGDPCTGEGHACSVTGDAWLRCAGGRFVLNGPCRGPAACSVQGSQVRCDQSRAATGDPCTTEGAAACDVSGQHMMRCDGSAFVQAQACPGGCAVEGTQVLCR